MQGSGTITISCENINAGLEQSNLSLTPGSYVKVSIKDTGSGISKENLLKIFIVFYDKS